MIGWKTLVLLIIPMLEAATEEYINQNPNSSRSDDVKGQSMMYAAHLLRALVSNRWSKLPPELWYIRSAHNPVDQENDKNMIGWKTLVLFIIPMLEAAAEEYINQDPNNTGSDDIKGQSMMYAAHLLRALVSNRDLPKAPTFLH